MKKFLFILLLYFSTTLTIYAHKVNIFYYTENNTIYLETYFSDGTKCRNSEISVYDNNLNKLLFKGKTNLKGEFQFKIPAIPKNHNLKIVLNAEMGHRNEVIVKPSEWLETDNIKEEAPSARKASISQPIEYNKSNCNCKKIEKILDKKLKPVLRELALLKEDKPSFNEIFGGIGYIFGLFGIIFYFKAKND